MSKQPGLFATAFNHLWDQDLTGLPRGKATLIGLLRIAYVVARDILQGPLTLHAMSLVYTTLLSIVPLLAIGFSVLKGFGIHNQIQPALHQFLAPLGEKGVEITDKVIEFVDNMQVGVLGALGLGLLIYTVISLIQKIEAAFNDTWHVAQTRSFARRFSDYLSVLVIGPVLVFAAVGIKASLMNHSLYTRISAIEPFGTLLGVLGQLMPHILVIAAFTFVYIFIPNTKVRFGPALIGGVISGVVWVTAGWLFASFVVGSSRYTAIYSAFATVIFAMIWIYVSWLIVLIGGTIAFYIQHPEYLTPHSGPVQFSNRVRERIALQITCQIAKTYYDDGDPWTLEALTKKLFLPREAAERVLLSLEEHGLLTQTSEEPPRFIPARPPDVTQVKLILDVVRSAGEHGQFALERIPATPAVKRLMDETDRATAVALHGLTLKELALDGASQGNLGDQTTVAPPEDLATARESIRASAPDR
jgi:membrane protein